MVDVITAGSGPAASSRGTVYTDVQVIVHLKAGTKVPIDLSMDELHKHSLAIVNKK